MKRIISISLILFCTLLLIQLGTSFFKKGHEVKYTVTSNDKVFTIYESYSKNKKHDYYYIEIVEGNHVYSFNYSNIYNKQKKIVKELRTFDIDDMLCIYPVLRDENPSNILCSNNKETYTYEAMHNLGKKEIDVFKDQLVAEKIITPAWNKSEEKIDFNGILVYLDNLIDNNYIVTWNYRGVNIIGKKENNSSVPINYDEYDNTHGVLVDHYYVIPNYDESYEFTELFIINILTQSKKVMTLHDKISFDSYISGVVDNKIYLFDRSNLVQYEIDPIKQKYRVMGNKDSNARYYNGKWQERNIYDFRDNKVLFDEEFDASTLINYYGNVSIKKIDNAYYFVKDGSVYVAYEHNLSHPVLLFKNNDISDIKYDVDFIYFLSNNTLYQYSYANGLKPVIENKEFIYNHQNIFDIYRK